MNCGVFEGLLGNFSPLLTLQCVDWNEIEHMYRVKNK